MRHRSPSVNCAGRYRVSDPSHTSLCDFAFLKVCRWVVVVCCFLVVQPSITALRINQTDPTPDCPEIAKLFDAQKIQTNQSAGVYDSIAALVRVNAHQLVRLELSFQNQFDSAHLAISNALSQLPSLQHLGLSSLQASEYLRAVRGLPSLTSLAISEYAEQSVSDQIMTAITDLRSITHFTLSHRNSGASCLQSALDRFVGFAIAVYPRIGTSDRCSSEII